MSPRQLPRTVLAILVLGLASIPFVVADDPLVVVERSLGLSTEPREAPSPFGDLEAAGPGAVRTPSGIVVPVVRRDGDTIVGLSPCAVEVPVTGEAIDAVHFVIDAGHGGSEPGAVGPNGLAERDINLDVALRVRDLLEDEGATVVLTRDSDIRVTVSTRAALAASLKPRAFVSIHHNAAPLAAGPTIGSELYHQGADAESRRLAGLLHEEFVARLQPYLSEWAIGERPGALARLSATSGGDYYGVLRESAGTPAVLSEATYLSDPNEAALLATEDFRQAEAEAIVAALTRWATTEDPGSGFVEAKVSDASAGGGGGTTGCVDPPLG